MYRPRNMPGMAWLEAISRAAVGALQALKPKKKRKPRVVYPILWPSWEHGTYVKDKHGDLDRVHAPMVPREAMRLGKVRS